MKLIFVSLVGLAASANAELYITKNLKGIYLDGPTSVSALELRPGTAELCKKATEVPKTFDAYKCQLKDSGADLVATSDRSTSRFRFNALSVFDYAEPRKPEDITTQYYYKGTWEHEFQGSTLSSPAVLMIYRTKGEPNLFRGVLELSTYHTKGSVELK